MTDYPDNYFDEIRPRVMKRAGMRCEHCDIGHEWSFLSIVQKDENGDWQDDNLVALCKQSFITLYPLRAIKMNLTIRISKD